MRNDIRTSQWAIGRLAVLILGLVATKALAGEPEPMQDAESTTSPESPAKTISVQNRHTEQEMIEEQRRMSLPRVPECIVFLEDNYRSTRSLEYYIRDLNLARDPRSLPVMVKVLLQNPRGINRAMATTTIALTEDYNDDRSAVSALVEALDDTITDVQFHAAMALVSLEDSLHPMPVLTKLARGEDKENWSADWEGYMGLDNATTEEIEQEKKKFKDRLQSKAIRLLRHLSTEEALSVLRSVGIDTEEDKMNILIGQRKSKLANPIKQEINGGTTE